MWEFHEHEYFVTLIRSHDQRDKRNAKNQYKSKKHQQMISTEKSQTCQILHDSTRS